MDLQTFNRSLLVGWLLLLVGGVLIHPGWGLAVGGLSLILLTFAVAYVGGLKAQAAAAASAQRAEPA